MWCNSRDRPELEGVNIESNFARQAKGGKIELIGAAGDISHPSRQGSELPGLKT